MLIPFHSVLATTGLVAAGYFLPNFIHGLLCDEHSQACLDNRLRHDLSEKQIDKMLCDSFPASDPPSTY